MNRLKALLFVWTVLAVVGFSCGNILYWAYWPQVPIHIKYPLKIKEVKYDHHAVLGTITYTMDYCKDAKWAGNDAVVRYSIWNVDHSALIELRGEGMAELPTGCHKVDVRLVIPELDSGLNQLEMSRTYVVNPLRRVMIQSSSAFFSID